LYNKNHTSYCFIEEEKERGRGKEEEGNLAADPKTYPHSAVTASVSFFPHVPFLTWTNANLETGFRKTWWLYFPFKEKEIVLFWKF